MSSETRYCVCCGEESPTNTITRHGQVELTCAYCGFVLETVKGKEGAAAHPSSDPGQPSAETEVAAPKAEPVGPEGKDRPLPAAAEPRKKKAAQSQSGESVRPTRASVSKCIIISDDADLTRGLLNATLINRKLTQAVISTENGQEFIKAFSKRLSENQPVNLVILDLEMPVMNGIMAARVMRAIEQKVGANPVPILFFSARKCDEELRKQLSIFSPAVYVNKGSETDPAKLMGRIDRLVEYLLEKSTPIGS